MWLGNYVVILMRPGVFINNTSPGRNLCYFGIVCAVETSFVSTVQWTNLSSLSPLPPPLPNTLSPSPLYPLSPFPLPSPLPFPPPLSPPITTTHHPLHLIQEIASSSLIPYHQLSASFKTPLNCVKFQTFPLLEFT